MKIPSFASLAGLFVFAAGCASIPSVGPNYHPPQTAVSTNWSEPQLGGTTNSPVQIVEWWKTFNDPELDSLVERAVKANYNLRLAVGRLHEARATVSGAEWDFTPTIGTSAGFTRQRSSANFFGAPTTGLITGPGGATPGQNLTSDQYDAHFDATWELDVFGSKRRTLEEDTANLAASREDLRDTLVTVLSDVARNYMEVRGAQQRLVIASNNIASQIQSIELTQARYKAGLTSELDVRQAQALLATTKATVPTMQTTLSNPSMRSVCCWVNNPGRCWKNCQAPSRFPQHRRLCRSVCRRNCYDAGLTCAGRNANLPPPLRTSACKRRSCFQNSR